jgi:hypothetical protein
VHRALETQTIRQAARARRWFEFITAAFAAVLLALALFPCSLDATSPNDQPSTPSDALERMARMAFGPLSAAELRMVRTAPTRDVAWVSPVQDPDVPANNPGHADSWGKERSIRASLLVWLITDPNASKLVHPSGIGVAGAKIIGELDLSYLSIATPLTLIDCAIADGVDLSFARIRSIDLRKCWTGPIAFEQTIVNGDVSLRYGHYGEVSMFRSTIAGTLDCSSGNFVGDDPMSVVETTIRGDALFHQGFTTGGVIYFRLSRIGQSLSFNDAIFNGNRDNGLNAERATVGGTLYWVDIKTTPRTELDLSNAHVGALWDDEKSWPAFGNLFINGFVYGTISGGPSDSESRLEWLRRQPITMWAQPQPYRQLALVLRANGRPEGATVVEVARENAITDFGGGSFGDRLWRHTLRWTIGYGYRPLQALWWILGFVVVGSVLFRWGYAEQLITPTEESAYQAFVKTGTPPIHYPPFNSFIYSLENFLPVVELHQGDYWRPNPLHRSTRGRKRFRFGSETMPARLLRWYLWLHILAGWTITPLLFAGLAGLLRSG